DPMQPTMPAPTRRPGAAGAPPAPPRLAGRPSPVAAGRRISIVADPPRNAPVNAAIHMAGRAIPTEAAGPGNRTARVSERRVLTTRDLWLRRNPPPRLAHPPRNAKRNRPPPAPAAPRARSGPSCASLRASPLPAGRLGARPVHPPALPDRFYETKSTRPASRVVPRFPRRVPPFTLHPSPFGSLQTPR